MFKKILHIGIAVTSLKESIKRFEDLGLTCEGREEVASEGVRVAFFPVGESRLELLEATSPDSAVARFIEKRGPGVHHICLQTEDLSKRIDELKSKGFQFTGDPIKGAHGVSAAFIHPKSLGGVMVEIAEGGY
ncbi:methylmalonyl-CoA epimerase [Bdellovibrionota bacterium]